MHRDLRHRLRAIFRREVVEREVDEELRHHFDLQVDRYLAAGWTRDAAARQARLDIGGVDQATGSYFDLLGLKPRRRRFAAPKSSTAPPSGCP